MKKQKQLLKQTLFLLILIISISVKFCYSAAQDVGPFALDYARDTTPRAHLMDADGEKVAFIFQTPKAGDIDKLYFRTGTVTTGDTLKVSLQDVDTADGDPDETVDESGTVAVGNGDDNTWHTITLDSDRTVTKGQFLSIVIEFDSYVAGNLNINSLSSSPSLNSANSYTTHKTGGSWSKQARAPMFVVEYTGASYEYISGVSPGVVASNTYNNTDTPDERGIIFQFAAPVTVTGAIFYGRLTGDTDIVLYDSDGSTVLETISLDKDIVQTASDAPIYAMFDGTQSLTKDTNYRITVKPSSATDLRLYEWTVDSANYLGQMPGGTNIYSTERTDGGGWTDTTTQRHIVVPIISQADDGASGGGGGGALSVSTNF